MMMLVSSDSAEDLGLVRAAAAGDRAAFGQLYLRYARMVHGILLGRVPPHEAEDMVQDVFVSALRRLAGLRAAAAFPGWLAAIARNRAMDYHRGCRGHVPLDEKRAEAPVGEGAVEDSFLVLDVVRRLPEAYRETLILRLVEGMTGPEIALRTGLTPESVRVNLCRGMKMLRELLKGMEAK